MQATAKKELTPEGPAPGTGDPAAAGVGGPYAWYVLFLMLLVYVLNFVDRQIMSILAEDIKADLGVGDAEMGFLFGTVFGVFYALFGIPLGRLADMWHRVRLLSLGLGLWSTMTAVSGFAGSFVQLAVARIGVGVGEGSASPVAYSLLSDWFPREQRATAIAIYSSGLYLGSGLSLFIGGLIVEQWNGHFPGGGPLGLVGWQAAFLAVGTPGILLALWIATLREPWRGQSEGLSMPPDPRPWPKFFTELASVLPPFTVLHVAGFGRHILMTNLLALLLTVAVIWALSVWAGNWPQWLALGLACYAVFSWQQSLKCRDRPTWQLIWGTRPFLFLTLACGIISMTGYSISFWQAPYAIRTFGVDKASAGFFLGGGTAVAGFISVIVAGRLADRLRRTNPAGRIIVGFITILGPIPFLIIQFTTSSLPVFYVSAFVTTLFSASWFGMAGATCQDLVLPRMRGAATATFLLGTTVIGLGLGPYLVGRLSDAIGNLGTANLALIGLAPLSLTCMWMVYRGLPAAEASRVERARVAGELI